MKNNLDGNYSLCGFVKPGINIATQTSSKIADINLLTKNTLIIFWGGSNDESKNNSQEGLKHQVHFVQSNNHTNITLMCVPPRHDLPEWSCVNNEIRVFNRKLSKIMKLYNHVLMVSADTDRKFFTRPGLHLNNSGKEKIASKVSMIVKIIFQKQNVTVGLCWKNGFDISVKSASDKQTAIISAENVSGNLTENTIPYRKTLIMIKQH